jgi:hypothetical protein
MVRAVHTHSRVVLAVVALAAGACAPLVEMAPPSDDGPHIAELHAALVPAELGCEVTFAFGFEAPDDEVTSVTAGWVWRLGRRARTGRDTLSVPDGTFRGHPRGDAVARTVPLQSGTYTYYVQVEDRSGRKSNVLRTTVSVGGWGVPEC